MKIAIDIGHASGTGAYSGGYEEHELADRIGSALALNLRKLGHSATSIDFPSSGNTADLNAAIKAINAGTAWGSYDFAISVHCDSSDNASAKGAHVIYASAKGALLAESIAKPLCAYMPGRSDKTVKRTNLAILTQTKPVTVLVECGFISNPEDAKKLRFAAQTIADKITEGVQNYLGGSGTQPATTAPLLTPLQYGDSGERVKKLQESLNKAIAIAEDGVFGIKTSNAIFMHTYFFGEEATQKLLSQ